MLDLTISTGMHSYLALTKFAAAEIHTIAGGWHGFTYRISLRNPGLEKTVVVKHSSQYASLDRSTSISVERMTFEYEALTAIAKSGLCTPDSTVQVPSVLLYDPQTYTLIMNDLAPARTLSSVLLEAFESGAIESVSEQIGTALGDFMGRFHKWGAHPEQAGLRKRFSQNETAMKFTPARRYRWMLEVAEKYGLREEWMDELSRQGISDAQNGGSVIAMGDFWLENILVVTEPKLRIYIIDWEMTRCGRPEGDVGDIASSTFTMAHVFQSPPSTFTFMRHFMQSYRKHFVVDDVQIALFSGRDAMSFGAIMPWTKELNQDIKMEILRRAYNLLKAGKGRNVEEIRRTDIVRYMYPDN